jgi:peptidoglycan/xylan/chitin deacetylase (PgdA/CDA1 family)
VTGLILCYHRVASVHPDTFRLCVKPERFSGHLAVLARYADVVPLTALSHSPPRRIRSFRWSRPQVALTFDDGYADNADTLPQLLAAAGVPATVFVVTDALGGEDEFWWDQLEHMVMDSPVSRAELLVRGTPIWADLHTPGARARVLRGLDMRLRTLPPDEIESALVSLGAQLGVSLAPCGQHRRLGLDGLERLDRHPLIDIGGHTRKHPWLSSLRAQEQAGELVGCGDDLSGLLGHPVTTFAYPFGDPGCFDGDTVGLLREAGFRSACTTSPGRVRPSTDPYRLPRHYVEDWSPPEFEERLGSWLGR